MWLGTDRRGREIHVYLHLLEIFTKYMMVKPKLFKKGKLIKYSSAAKARSEQIKRNNDG